MDGDATHPMRCLRDQAASGRSARRCRADSGIMTLEWLLIVAAVAGIAAVSTLTVQRVVDDAVEVPADPVVRVIDADIAAAQIVAEAQAVFDAYQMDQDQQPPYDDADFELRCASDLPAQFADVVSSAVWARPEDAEPATPSDLTDDTPARCTVTPKPDLAG